MPGVGIALGALARGMGNVLGQKHQQELQQKQNDRQFQQHLVEVALSSGRLDPEHIPEAMNFFAQVSAGKKYNPKTPLPPALDTVLRATMQAGGGSGGGASGNAAASADVAPATRPSSVSPFLSAEQVSQRETAAEVAKKKALTEAEFAAKKTEILLEDPNISPSEMLDRMGFGKPPRPTGIPQKGSIGDLVLSAVASKEAELGRDLTSEEYQKVAADVRGKQAAATRAPVVPKSPTLDGRFVELQALKAGGDPKYAVMDDVQLRAEAARQITNERLAVQTERRNRYNQYVKTSNEQILKDEVALAYMKENQPLLLEAKRLGIDTAKANLASAKALAEALTGNPQSSIFGQSVETATQKLMEEGAEAGKAAPAAAPAKAGAIPLYVQTALKGGKVGTYTMKDGTKWHLDAAGTITPVKK